MVVFHFSIFLKDPSVQFHFLEDFCCASKRGPMDELLQCHRGSFPFSSLFYFSFFDFFHLNSQFFDIVLACFPFFLDSVIVLAEHISLCAFQLFLGVSRWRAQIPLTLRFLLLIITITIIII